MNVYFRIKISFFISILKYITSYSRYPMFGTFLKGKTAMITGSLSGIGLGIARSLSASGANIVLNGFAP